MRFNRPFPKWSIRYSLGNKVVTDVVDYHPLCITDKKPGAVLIDYWPL